jgi:type VI secretion system secreted protein VgrG
MALPPSLPLSFASPAFPAQHARLLALDTPLGPDVLVVERFRGKENLSGLFRFELDCLCASAHLELKTLLGEEVTLRLLQADGSPRLFHGIVSGMRQQGSDGGLASYRLTLAPWLHALSLRRDCYVFQDKNVLDIAAELFGDYPNSSYRFAVQAALPARPVTMQYRESDYDFLARLLAEEGLNYFFEHAQEGERNDGQARHRLVIFDDAATLEPCAQPQIRFHRAAATEDTDTVTLWSQCRQVQANAVTLASWDERKLAATTAEDGIAAGGLPVLEIYEGGAAVRHADTEDSARLARARAESLAMAQQRVEAESSVRPLAVGTWFSLAGHANADGDYTVLSIAHQGANNLFSGLGHADEVEAGTYRNRFTCVPRSLPIRPDYRFPKPTAPGWQIALVVGVEGEEITTERDHRVKIQFPWQRGARAVSGQQDHPSTSNAPGDERAGAWVRVAEPAAGANWGAHFIPRIGQEVLVDFLAGDIDRPVVIGQVYNGCDTPPLHGADNHAGALAGIKSKEYAGQGFNQWMIDDTPAQLRQGLASTYRNTQLNIGYLIRQQGNVRGAYRGTGFELATDAWATLRAKRGLFVTTAARENAGSTQLDAREAQDKLQAAGDLAQTLSDAAVRHQALPLSNPQGARQWTKMIGGSETADGQQAPAFAQPVTHFDSQAGISIATPASSVLFAGQDLTFTAATDLRMTGGQAVSAVAGKAVSLFTHAGGAKVIAAKETVSVRAHTGPMDLLADNAMTVTSSNGEITIQAKQEILLASGGGYIRLKGGDIDIHCPAQLSVKGSTHAVKGAASMPADLQALPQQSFALVPAPQSLFVKYDEQIIYKDPKNEPIEGHLLYRLDNKAAQQTLRGRSPGKGETERIDTPQAQDLDYGLRYAKFNYKG